MINVFGKETKIHNKFSSLLSWFSNNLLEESHIEKKERKDNSNDKVKEKVMQRFVLRITRKEREGKARGGLYITDSRV